MKTEKQIDKGPLPADNERVRQIEFSSEGKTLQGTIFSPEIINGKTPGLIFIHGSPSRGQAGQTEYAHAIATAGYMAMTFDLSGHGASQGDAQSLAMENYVNDVIEAYDHFIAEETVDPKNITLVGSSLGAYLATMLTQQRAIENLVLQNPANFPDNELAKPVASYAGTEPVIAWRKEQLKSNDNSSLKALHEFNGNVLIIESEYDEFIPHQNTKNYIDAIKDPQHLKYEILPGAKHYLADPAQRMQYQNKLIAWLKEKCPLE